MSVSASSRLCEVWSDVKYIRYNDRMSTRTEIETAGSEKDLLGVCGFDPWEPAAASNIHSLGLSSRTHLHTPALTPVATVHTSGSAPPTKYRGHTQSGRRSVKQAHASSRPRLLCGLARVALPIPDVVLAEPPARRLLLLEADAGRQLAPLAARVARDPVGLVLRHLVRGCKGCKGCAGPSWSHAAAPGKGM